MRSSLILAMALLALSSCGRFDRIENGGFTEVRFTSPRADQFQASSTLTNGIIITAYSASYVTNIKLADETSSASIVLPNGTYSFFGIGYNYAINTNGADMRCAIKDGANAAILNGTAQTVSLDFTQANCNNTAFRPSASFMDQYSNTSSTQPNKGPAFAQLDFIFCSSDAGSGGTSLSNIASTQDCGTMGGTGISSPYTNISKFQVVFPIFKSINGNFTRLGEAYRSACANSYPSALGTPAMSQYIRYPVGSTQVPGAFPMEVEAFSDGSCMSPPVITSRFHKGLNYGENNGAIMGTALANTSSTNRARVYMRAQ